MTARAFNLSDPESIAIDRMQERTGIATRTNVVRLALRLLEEAVDVGEIDTEENRTVYVCDSAGEEIRSVTVY